MWDLANNCENLTTDKLCLLISESEKAKANRQLRCKNEEKMSCCYLCQSRHECGFKCMFLGKAENQPSPVILEKTEPESSLENVTEPQADQTERAPTPYCSSCNAEMRQTRTVFKIEGWQKRASDGTSSQGELPVIVYVCPQCGKIEFKADNQSI